MAFALEYRDVTKRFGSTFAVDGLTLQIEPGAFVGLLGRNGAGKTTAINLAVGLLRPTSGAVTTLGLDVHSEPIRVKQQIGVMPQEESLFDFLTGAQYLHFVGRIYGLGERQIGERTVELFDTLDLHPSAATLVREYSYGMRKKLGLCAALIHAPTVLFLDEPFEGIDPVTSRTMKNMLTRLHEKGVTILMSSHVLEVVERLCPLVAIIDRGRLLGYGSVDELRGRHGDSGSLEELFVSLMGGSKSGELSWL